MLKSYASSYIDYSLVNDETAVCVEAISTLFGSSKVHEAVRVHTSDKEQAKRRDNHSDDDNTLTLQLMED